MFLTFKHIGFHAKESVFMGNFTALLYSKEISSKILVETYNNHALLETTFRDWFRHFKNNDFDVEDKACPSAPKKFEDEEFGV